MVRNGLDSARSFGIELSFDAQRYVYLAFGIFKGFRESLSKPWATSILEDDTMPAGWKLEQLEGNGLLCGDLEESTVEKIYRALR